MMDPTVAAAIPSNIHRTISAHKIQGKLSTRKFKCDEPRVSDEGSPTDAD